MRFGIRALSVLFFLQALACGTPEESDEDRDSMVQCAAGESVSPITGMCMSARIDMAMDMTSTTQDMFAGTDMLPLDMGADMACAPDKTFNPITGMCVSDTTEEDMGSEPDAMMMADLGQQDMPADMTQEVDMAAGDFGVLTGQVTRSTAPKNGGIGPVFVALFERNPITSGENAGLVSFQRIEGVDFNPANTSIPYRLEAIPPRDEAYFIIAFLDDNMSADVSMPSSAGPDRNDLVSLDGVGAPKVTIDMAGESMLDLDLNFALPF